MVRKHLLYQFAGFVWFALSVGGVVAIMLGEAEPYISPTDIPGGGPGAFGVAAASILAGIFVISTVERRSWKKAGKKSGLEPEGGLHVFGRPAMTGSVHGRPVRVDTYKVKHSTGEGTSSTTYTLVEAKLSKPLNRGFFFHRGDSVSTHVDDDIPDQLQTQRVGGEFVVLGDIAPEIAEALPTPRVQSAYQDGGSAGVVVVGDPTDTIMSVVPDTGGGLAGAFTGMVADKFRDKEGFDAETVAYTRKGLMLDPEEMGSQVEAVAAVADAFESAARRQQ